MKLNEKKLSLRFRAKTFYFASFFLPKKLKQEIEILYIFCRFIDDLGDSNNSSKTYILKYLKRIKSVEKSPLIILLGVLFLNKKQRLSAP